MISYRTIDSMTESESERERLVIIAWIVISWQHHIRDKWIIRQIDIADILADRQIEKHTDREV